MVGKLLAQIKASDRDPEFDKQRVYRGSETIPFIEYFQQNGIRPFNNELVVSCHGNTDLNLIYVSRINELAKDGHRVVAIEAGGFYFAKPGIDAANMPTVPVISVPLDGVWYGGVDAFLAPFLPSGTAAIAGVGQGDYSTAAIVAKEILTNTFVGVYTYNASPRMLNLLEHFGIPVLGEAGSGSRDGMIVGMIEKLAGHEFSYFDGLGRIGIYSPPNSRKAEDIARLMDCCALMRKSAFTRGEENVAYLAAKIMAPYNSQSAERLKEAAQKKRMSYAERTITLDSFRRV